MQVVDVNVLVALFVEDHPHHGAASAWWDEVVSTGEPFTVPEIVWMGFARLMTSGRTPIAPVDFATAWEFAAAVMAQPMHTRFATDPRTLEEFAELNQQARAKGNLVTDAYIAACAATYGATVVTFDRDFRKFDGVKVKELAPS
ncbi:MAG TPA: TA system VapC family ribonuclease toxin [Marmoricola sp.]